MISLLVKVPFRSESSAKMAAEALLPELNARHEKRSLTSVKANKNILLLDIEAVDASSLKASMMSYLKLINLESELHGGD